jgi:1,4-dihydroxy-2-naphthoate octaprenyltransferase
MTTAAQWIEGARPRTLPAALSPVLVGTGAAIALGHGRWDRALLALVVALALQVGVNYANDYSDGIRPYLLLVGALALAAAWGYTGGKNPYGYRGLGEISVFVFFGLVAVIGTTYVQTEHLSALALGGGVASGSLACAILVTNNLRDIPTDTGSGKKTLAVRLGDARSRALYQALLVVPFLVAGLVSYEHPGALLALLAIPLALGPLRLVRGGAVGRDLVAVLQATGKLQLAYGVLLALGLAIS